jgi:hypothetical protein
MTDGVKSQEEQELRAQVRAGSRERLERLAADLRVVDEEVESAGAAASSTSCWSRPAAPSRRSATLGAASLFWGDRIEPARVAEQLREVRSRVSAFQAQLGELDGRRQAIVAGIGREEDALEILAEDLYEAPGGGGAPQARMDRRAGHRPAADAHPGDGLGARRRGRPALPPVAGRITAGLPAARCAAADDRSAAAEALRAGRQAVEAPRAARPGGAGDTAPPPPVPMERLRSRPRRIRRSRIRGEPPPSRTFRRRHRPWPRRRRRPRRAPGPDAPAVAAAGPPQQNVTQAGILAFRDQFASRAKDRWRRVSAPMRASAMATT